MSSVFLGALFSFQLETMQASRIFFSKIDLLSVTCSHIHTDSNSHLVPAHHAPTVPKLIRTKIQHNMTREDWNAFLRGLALSMKLLLVSCWNVLPINARVQGKAETFEFKTMFIRYSSNYHAPMTREVFFTNEVILDLLLNGIADLDICREILSTESIQTKLITETIVFVETREAACSTNPTSAVSALSEY